MDYGRGSKIIAARDLDQNQKLDLLGIVKTIPGTEVEILKTQNADFSIMTSDRNKKPVLFIGPASLLNHNCDPNCKYESVSTSTLRICTLRTIKEGEELFTYYGREYFEKMNENCECQTCEQNMMGAFSMRGTYYFVINYYCCNKNSLKTLNI